MIFALVLTIVFVLTVTSIAAVVHLTARRPTERRATTPPVTILKPLCGADDALEANLETFFRQTYPRFELVFGVEGDADPALPIVRRLRARHPEVACRVVVHDGRRALNPKVSNLRAMLEWGSYDLVVVSDSNVAVRPEWLAQMVAEMEGDRELGLLTNLFVGVGEETIGAALENLHLAGPVAGSIAVTNEVGHEAATVGKSMMFRRTVFDGLGGLESVGAFLAEDHVMGRMFASAGYKVRLAPTLVDNVVRKATVQAFLKRHVRWGLLRSRLMPLLYPFEPLANPMLLVVLALFSGALGPALAVTGVALTLLRDAVQWWRLRGPRGLVGALPLGPVKDLAMLVVWAIAPLSGRVAWRGKSYRVGAGTRLYADRTMAAPERLEWE
ncbi:MAG: glycosyltransferase [Deltaproteobacteria bacterium]|nr:glycosyltransferase [Deltaproteobacteria bacterium]